MADQLGGYWELANLLKSVATSTSTRQGSAVVRDIDADGTVWVAQLGSDEAVPANGVSVASVSVGDAVTVEVSSGKLSITGNATAPSVGQTDVDATVDPVRVTAQSAEDEAIQAMSAATTAQESADAAADAAEAAQTSADTAADAASAAQSSADSAASAASAAQSTATAAQTSANNAASAASAAQTSADNANEYAARALGNLSTVQSVAETLSWITEHGTMTLTTDTALDPTHVYFVVDADGDYAVGSTTYSVVTEPDADDLATYYELSIDESLNNYVGTHLALTDEGLWIIPASSGGYKILIATGAGSTYTTAGTYIVDGDGGIVAEFTADSVTIGETDSGNYAVIDADSFDIYHSSTQMAHFGYGEGTDEDGGTSVAPYYTIGTRASGSTVGNYSTAEGYDTTASGYASHAEGHVTTSRGAVSHVEGYSTTAIGQASHAEGQLSTAGGFVSHAEGYQTTAYDYSHAEGQLSIAKDNASHAEGYSTYAINYSHAEGYDTTASGYASHAEGDNTTASNTASHAEGGDTTASGYYSHAEGDNTTASGYGSHAEGKETTASGSRSHAEGYGTTAASNYQHVQGAYNVEDSSGTYAHIVGNGTADNARSNAHTLDWSGNAWYAGDVTDGTGNVLSDKADSSDLAGYLPLTGGTLTGDVTTSGNITAANIGTVVDDYISSYVSVATSAWTSIGSVTLAAGTWMLSYTAQFASNSTGRRYVVIHETADATSTWAYRHGGLNQDATQGAMTLMTGAGLRTLSSSTTIYLNLYQDSGSTLNCLGYISAVRIK